MALPTPLKRAAIAAEASAPLPGVATMPTHLAIIMDGNGRWAARRGLPRVAGHRAGVEAVRRVLRATMEAGIGWLTLYAFSSENWRRPAAEIPASSYASFKTSVMGEASAFAAVFKPNTG